MLASAAIQPNFGARQIIRVFLCGDVMTGRGIGQIIFNQSLVLSSATSHAVLQAWRL
jgi:hypothetical protein